jgi:hypothetical protein
MNNATFNDNENNLKKNNTTLSGQFPKLIDYRRKMQNRYPTKHIYMTAHVTGLVQPL